MVVFLCRQDTAPVSLCGGAALEAASSAASSSGSGGVASALADPTLPHHVGDMSTGCDAILTLPNECVIRHYRYGRFEATCALSHKHGKACRRTMTSKPPVRSAVYMDPSQGWCLGYLVSWCIDGAEENKNKQRLDHKNFVPSDAQRVDSRKWLVELCLHDAAARNLLRKERPGDDGEPLTIEPLIAPQK